MPGKGKFDAVLCWRFDRFARSTKHLINALEEFRHLEIEFISYQENIDTGSPLGKAIFTIVSAIARTGAKYHRGRVRGGIRRAKENGKTLGRPKRLDLVHGDLRSGEVGVVPTKNCGEGKSQSRHRLQNPPKNGCRKPLKIAVWKPTGYSDYRGQ